MILKVAGIAKPGAGQSEAERLLVVVARRERRVPSFAAGAITGERKGDSQRYFHPRHADPRAGDSNQYDGGTRRDGPLSLHQTVFGRLV